MWSSRLSGNGAPLMPDTRRLFFALWPTAELRDALVARMAAMTHMPCRPMAPSNLHVTLAFLGSVSNARVADLMALARGIQFTACELAFDRLAVWKQARVLVLTAAQVPEPLQQLVDELQSRLNEAGFSVDARPFRPHVTLARDVKISASDEEILPIVWPARDFVLVESVSTESGVQYKVIATFGD